MLPYTVRISRFATQHRGGRSSGQGSVSRTAPMPRPGPGPPGPRGARGARAASAQPIGEAREGSSTSPHVRRAQGAPDAPARTWGGHGARSPHPARPVSSPGSGGAGGRGTARGAGPSGPSGHFPADARPAEDGRSSSVPGTTTRKASVLRSMTTVARPPSARHLAAYSSAGHEPRGAPAGNRSSTFAPIAVLHLPQSVFALSWCGCPGSTRTCRKHRTTRAARRPGSTGSGGPGARPGVPGERRELHIKKK